jgi:hypothetical protein
MLIDQSQQVILWNLIFQSEVVEQRFRACVLTHHERSSSESGHPQQHGQTMLLNNSHCHSDFITIASFVLSFSTPTPVVVN